MQIVVADHSPRFHCYSQTRTLVAGSLEFACDIRGAPLDVTDVLVLVLEEDLDNPVAFVITCHRSKHEKLELFTYA